MKTTAIFILINFVFITASFSQITIKEEVEKIRSTIKETKTDIDWEAFDTTSTISIDKIKIEDVQGLWKAYNGLFKFNDNVNSMILTIPFIVEFKEDKGRRSLDLAFGKFIIKKNEIILRKFSSFYGTCFSLISFETYSNLLYGNQE